MHIVSQLEHRSTSVPSRYPWANAWQARLHDLCLLTPFQGYLKAANYLHERHPSCLSPAAPLWLSHQRFLLCQALLLTASDRGERQLRAEQSAWEGIRRRRLCHSACQFLHIFSHLASGLMCNYASWIKRTKLDAYYCWLVRLLRGLRPRSKRSHAETSCHCANATLKYFNGSVKISCWGCWRHPVSSWVLQIINPKPEQTGLSSQPATPSSLRSSSYCSFNLNFSKNRRWNSTISSSIKW